MAARRIPTSSPTSNGSASCSRPASSSPRRRWSAPEQSSTAVTPTASGCSRSASRSVPLGPEREPEPVIADFEALRAPCARLELLAEGLRRRRRSADPAGARGAAARLRRDPAPRPRGPRARPADDGVRPGSCSSACSTERRPRPVVGRRGKLEASARRMERLLRETGVPAGLLFNGRALRLISAPRGESSGWLDFRVADMVQTAGRPICTAMRLLLGEPRLLTLPRDAAPRRAAARQPRVPERGVREARRAGAARAVRAVARLPGRARRVGRRAAARSRSPIDPTTSTARC